MPRRRRRPAKKHVDFLKKYRHLYEDILAAQNGGCAICSRKPSPRRKLDLDHDHSRMVVRGLLCTRCNRALTYWITSAWLRAAALYLEQKPIGLTKEMEESIEVSHQGSGCPVQEDPGEDDVQSPGVSP